MAVIEVKNLVKTFGKVTAVNGISFRVESGEILSLVGASGCGKTTTLRSIAGLDQPTSGRIEMDGELLFSEEKSVPPERRDIGMVFQSYALWPHMTVAQNIGYGLKVQGNSKQHIDRKVADVARLVGLVGLTDRYVSELSGGQQQRVALARALALEPKAVLFDEPLSNLDAKLREHVRVELRRLLNKLKITAIYVTHDQAEAMVISDRVAVMEAGSIRRLGAPADVYQDPRDHFVADFLGSVNVLQGEVQARGADLMLALGPDLVVRCGSVLGAGKAGDTMTVAIRPEHVEVSPSPLTGENTCQGVVEEVVFLGSTQEYLVRVGTIQITALQIARKSTALLFGSACFVRLPEADFFLLND